MSNMKIEDTPLTRYLVKNLQPLTEADPALLANYVLALLKNNKPKKELQKLCVDKLYDFLGDGTKSFVTALFHALEDGSIPTSIEKIEGTNLNDGATTVASGGPTELRSSSPKPERLPSAAIRVLNDLEEKEISDDDDDDRNHKHRRRVTRSQSFDREGEEDDETRPIKKRGRLSDNGQSLQESEAQFSDRCREYTPLQTEREGSIKFDKKRHGSSPFPRLNVDGGQKAAKGGQTYRVEPAPRFDVQNSFVRAPLGRGRGRSIGSWAPHDSRFTSIETVDFPSAMPPQGPTSSNIYPARPISNPGNSANSSWNAFGLIPGMPNGGLEQLHTLHAGMQGGRAPPLNPTIGLTMGMGRPRCRDFEERGFCLRGDMCPMEHGLNRIVVEDVQSLSQFNLPVSLPGGHLLGMKTGSVGPAAAVVSSLPLSNKNSYNKNTRYGVNEDASRTNGMTIASAENEPDFYDPDQPLWKKDHPNASGGLMLQSSPRKGDGEHLWEDDSSDRHSCQFSDSGSERPGRSIGTGFASHNMVPSVCGRFGVVDAATTKSGLNRMGDMSSELVKHGKYFRKEVHDEQHSYGPEAVRQGNCDNETETYKDIGFKSVHANLQHQRIEGSVIPRVHGESGSHSSSGFITRGNVSRGSRGKGTDRASCTLFVNCIPTQSNRREVLLSHFKKFGEVLDIHIPKISEKAFVQFVRRESAEAALTSPDAVIGNRFIRLSWANRDSVVATEESSATTVTPGSIPSARTIVQTEQIHAEKGKEKVYDVAPAVSGTSTFETPTMEGSALTSVTANDLSTPSFSAVQKKQERLELLEALRQKQEMLAEKRDSFRRQLDKLEKQGTVSRAEVSDRDQGTQRNKAEASAECANTSKSCNTNVHSNARLETGQRNENLITKSSSGDVPSQTASSSLLAHPVILQTSPKGLKLPFPRFPRPLAAPMFHPNRFKLDNRPTAFRILPPRPVGLMDIATLKEHFAVYGDLSSVEFDDVEGNIGETSKAPEKCSVRVIYTTRRAAERAFTHGKSWQGHNLQLAWVMPSNNTLNHFSVDTAVSQISKGSSDGAIAAENDSCAGAASVEKDSSCGVLQIEKETYAEQNVVFNGGRNTDNVIAENLMEGCGHSVTNINGGNHSDAIQCLSPQLQENNTLAKLDGSSSNNNYFCSNIPSD